MFKIIYSDFFKRDLKNISNFISQDNPINAIKTINSIIKTIKLLSDFPFLGKEVDEILREIVESNYKFKIVYQINKSDIIIYSVYKYKNNWK